MPKTNAQMCKEYRDRLRAKNALTKNSTERVRKHRARKRAMNLSRNVEVTLSTGCVLIKPEINQGSESETEIEPFSEQVFLTVKTEKEIAGALVLACQEKVVVPVAIEESIPVHKTVLSIARTEVTEESEQLSHVSLTIKKEKDFADTRELTSQDVMSEFPLVIEDIKPELKSEPNRSCRGENLEDPLAINEDISWHVQGSEMCQYCGYTSESKLEMELHSKVYHRKKASIKR